MARENTITATFRVSGGSSADSVSATVESKAFASGESVVINGVADSSGITYDANDFFGASSFANGLLFQNRDATHSADITIKDDAGTPATVGLFTIPAGGGMLIRTDTNINTILIACSTSGQTTEFTLALAE